MLIYQTETAMPAKRTDENLRKFQGDRLRVLRETLEISQDQLADMVGLKRQAVYKYEKGITSPTLDIAKRIAKVLRTNVSYLAGEIEYPGALPEHMEDVRVELQRRSQELGRPLTSGEIAEFYDVDKFGDDDDSAASGKPTKGR